MRRKGVDVSVAERVQQPRRPFDVREHEGEATGRKITHAPNHFAARPSPASEGVPSRIPGPAVRDGRLAGLATGRA